MRNERREESRSFFKREILKKVLKKILREKSCWKFFSLRNEKNDSKRMHSNFWRMIL